MPSGHTANAFLGTEFMAQELGDKSIDYSVVGNGFATATGILRIYNRDHCDVVAGDNLVFYRQRLPTCFIPTYATGF
ncbi:hypothetical protein [Mucilaginibacter pocheonensis]|uniref:Uncharacterized protein n=1 Tax=Mucilaginibacter pocheonensis TaxID=398050 RepID=A0ABU1T7T9_9SPHI|nr:hypothetical protein [Mucilaginibacter pocheonensis]MDR6940875.1 hypothetical protein [Mucilaginibacter pocheonensis]